MRLTWYTDIKPKPDRTVEILNTLKKQSLEGNQIFYDIYTDAEKATDSAKANTGLFFFKGDENAKFAIVNAGGGFSYVGTMHDSFPHGFGLGEGTVAYGWLDNAVEFWERNTNE